MRTNNITMKERGMKLMVKWLLCAAFFTLHSSLFTSCSDDLAEAFTDADIEDNTPLSRRAYSSDQIKIQRLGYAYNAAGNVMDDNSFSATPIINMDRLKEAERKYGPIISSERRHYTSMDIFSGNTLQEMGSSETKYTINDNDLIGCGKYYKNNTTLSATTWHNSYKAHMFVKHIMATMTIDVGTLYCMNLDDLENSEGMLEDDFRRDLAALVKKGLNAIDTATATTFSEKYGTHLVVSSNLGGMIELQMEIERDSCVDKLYTTQQVFEIVAGRKVGKTSEPLLIKEKLVRNTVKYKGEIKVKGGNSADCEKLHRTFDQERAAAVSISDGDYEGWANGVSIEPASYNASFVSGRFLPFYQLFEDATTRNILRQVYQMYLKKEAPTKEIYEPPYGIMPVAGNYGQDVRVAAVDTNKACIMCQEYVPSIRSDKPCVVAYPLIRGENGDIRPFFYSGLFVGDESHRPGRVIWEGSSSVYTPSDSIFAESDSIHIRNLFDEKTHALKNVYIYWNAVHAQPCSTKKDETPKNYTTTVYSIKPEPLAESTTFAKVASTFWSVRPVVPKTESLLQYWQGDSTFNYFVDNRYSANGGVLYKDGNYCYCLMDGGNNIVRAPQFTDDPDAEKQWIEAVSRSMKATGLKDYLPSVQQSKSITKMLGNRMNIFYDHSFGGNRNMLGLDWPTGYWVISHPRQKTEAAEPTKNDSQGIPIVTNDAGQARILRLSGSGTDLLLEYPEYVKAFNYSDQEFYKFLPLFITVDKF